MVYMSWSDKSNEEKRRFMGPFAVDMQVRQAIQMAQFGAGMAGKPVGVAEIELALRNALEEAAKDMQEGLDALLSQGSSGPPSADPPDFADPAWMKGHMRQAAAACLMMFPESKGNPREAEAQLRRIVERVLRDYREDAKAFGMEETNG